MEKERYEAVELEIIEFSEAADVITNSYVCKFETPEF